MTLTDEQKQNYKQAIINRFNAKYATAAQEVVKLRDDKLKKLDQAAQVQLDYNNSVSKDSLTMREIFELERNGTTTVD